jgi:hypothetical protein
LDQTKVPARIKVAQDSKACRQHIVIQRARLRRRNGRCRRAIQPGNRSQRREVRDDERVAPASIRRWMLTA